MNRSQFKVIGNGSIGDKALQLRRKRFYLTDIGFHMPKTYTFSCRNFDRLFQDNKLGQNIHNLGNNHTLEARILNADMNERIRRQIQRVSSELGPVPLAVRLSGIRDARGTGTYKTLFIKNNPNDVALLETIILEVISSYFSETAIKVREKTMIKKDGFGVMIQPVVGQKIDGAWTPYFSGFGYTSTSSGEGFINLVPGMLGGVGGYGVVITESQAREVMTLDNLKNIFKKEKWKDRRYGVKIHNGKLRSTYLYSPIELIHGSSELTRGYEGYVFKEGRLKKSIFIPQTQLKIAAIETRVDELFDMMNAMETEFGTPQYFEFALTIDPEPRWWILQISDIEKKLDVFNFGDYKDVLFDCHSIVGAGTKKSDKIVILRSLSEIDALYDFNKANENYIFIYNGAPLSASQRKSMSFKCFSNADVIIEYSESSHIVHPIYHLGGQIDLTNKLFGVLDRKKTDEYQLDRLGYKPQIMNGLEIYELETNTIASEKQNRMQVRLI